MPLMKTTQVPHIVGATRRCPCKQIGSVCRKYCHPNRTCVNRQQKPSEAELSCLSSEEETGISSTSIKSGDETIRFRSDRGKWYFHLTYNPWPVGHSKSKRVTVEDPGESYVLGTR